jgi:hypothetical protein
MKGSHMAVVTLSLGFRALQRSLCIFQSYYSLCILHAAAAAVRLLGCADGNLKGCYPVTHTSLLALRAVLCSLVSSWPATRLFASQAGRHHAEGLSFMTFVMSQSAVARPKRLRNGRSKCNSNCWMTTPFSEKKRMAGWRCYQNVTQAGGYTVYPLTRFVASQTYHHALPGVVTQETAGIL